MKVYQWMACSMIKELISLPFGFQTVFMLNVFKFSVNKIGLIFSF